MPTQADRLADSLLGRDAVLLRLDAGMFRSIEGILLGLRNDLVTAIQRSDLNGALRLSTRLQRVERLLVDTRQTIRSGFRSARDATLRELMAFAREEGGWIGGEIKSVGDLFGVSRKLLRPEVYEALVTQRALVQGATIGEWWSRQAGGFQRRFADQLRDGINSEESIDQIVRRIRGTATGRRVVRTAKGQRRVFHVFEGGIMKVTTREAEALVRSARNAVMAQARREMLAANDDIVKGIQQVSTLDNRTTEICLAYDGEWWEFPDMTPRGPKGLPYMGGLPRHWNERSTEIPVLKSWRELGFDADDIAPPLRESMDGRIPAATTADEWLKRQPQSVLQDLFGKGKAQLFAEGRISTADLLDQRGRPLTLAELKSNGR